MEENAKPFREIIVAVAGPTATGKTALAAALCLRAGGEVISADSMQIYQGMDIGTAKPGPLETLGVPHHLLNLCPPSENFSAARWTEMAVSCASDIFSRGKLPVVAGGTGLYIDSLLSGRDFAPLPGDPALRAALEKEYEQLGGEAFREKLRQVDPERAEKLHPRDKKRLVRAFEVWQSGGRTITSHDAETKTRPPRWPSLRYALNFARREDLYRRIDSRVDAMVSQGLFEEVRGLLDGGLDDSCTAMQAIGYKEAAACLRGQLGFDEAVERIKRETRRYAKRQLTWLRRDPELRWIVWDNAPDIGRGVEQILRDLGKR